MKKVYLELVKSVKQIIMLGMVLWFVSWNTRLAMEIFLAVPKSDRKWVIIGVLAVFSCTSWPEAVMAIGIAAVKCIEKIIKKNSR